MSRDGTLTYNKPPTQESNSDDGDTVRCTYCGGSGWTGAGKCDICRGSGQMPVRYVRK